MIRPAFAAHDHPIDPGQIERRQRPKQRLNRQEPDRRRDLAEGVGPPGVYIGLDGRADPHVRQRPPPGADADADAEELDLVAEPVGLGLDQALEPPARLVVAARLAGSVEHAGQAFWTLGQHLVGAGR